MSRLVVQEQNAISKLKPVSNNAVHHARLTLVEELSSYTNLFCLKTMTRDRACSQRNDCIFTILLGLSKYSYPSLMFDLLDYLICWEIVGERRKKGKDGKKRLLLWD